jgi:cytochrome c oxidase subunit 2
VVKTKQLFAGLILMTLGLGTAQADYTLNLMEGVTTLSRDVYGLHMLVFWVCVVIGIAVFGTMFYSIYFHRKSRGYKASNALYMER